ncbi:MAG: RrF2 family transcriptional regulator [Planctomycetota bacterium]|jgi:Rrf2 family protein
MTINRSTAYAILAVGYIAQHRKQDLIPAETISEQYNIPLLYLLKIMKDLAKANVLRSKRGPHGGYCLARTPKKINLLQVIEAVEGPVSETVNLGSRTRRDKFVTKADQSCRKAIAQAKALFRKTTLAELL